MDVKKVGIVGAGQMGRGIAQVFAVAGFDVVLHDIDEARVAKGKAAIEKSLAKSMEKGKLSSDARDAALKRITTTTMFEAMNDIDLGIEAATEEINTKLNIFRKLDKTTPKEAILASNTSSISISALANATMRPEKVIGMHFMNPVPIMKGVEVIRGAKTSNETGEVIYGLIEKLGKSQVRSADVPGFVANRILMPMIREAILTLEQNVAEKEDIDRCMVDCCNMPMGPLALADFIGLDTVSSILEVMADGLGSEYYRSPKLLQKLINQGKLGRKTGEGFYRYGS